jgi:Amt family ammonium transporter
MQAGFLCFESGSTRGKNNINVAAKNIIDFVLSVSVFWLIGFGLMFGVSSRGIVGTDQFLFGADANAEALSFFLFQMMFCGTAATLASGATAERLKFVAYVYITIILSLFIYPVAGHWIWSGVYVEGNQGWLESLGFVDFAGSTVVHSVGGWVALAAIIVIGARTGRFSTDIRFPSGSNLPLASLGVFLIWLGWFGFNGGSTLEYNHRVPKILFNTCLAAVWSCLFVTLIHYFHKQYVNVSESLNGIIAGLVGITASCHAVSPLEAMLIGLVSGGLMYGGSLWLYKLKIDDALNVVPAHLFAGIWGTLAVALFGDPVILNTGLSVSQQFTVQLIGVLSVGCYAFVISYLAIIGLNALMPLRVSPQDEKVGLNIREHMARTELFDLLSEMDLQQQTGMYTKPVTAEPHTEIGQIASKYNQVIARVAHEISQRDAAIEKFKTSELRKSAILDSSMDSIVSMSNTGMITEFNHAAEKTFGCLRTSVIGRSFIDSFVKPEDRDTIASSLEKGFSSSEGLLINRRNNLELLRVSGDYFPAEITVTSSCLASANITEYTLNIRDVAKDIKLKKRLQYLAYMDPLTDLSNRTHMTQQLKVFVEEARLRGLSVALYFLDLDKFKKINDTLGHEAGDELLGEVANRLKRISRDTDIVARWGGDEFIYIISGKLDRHVIEDRAHKILSEMRGPISIKNKHYTIPTSIGIAISKYGSVSADDLIRQADIAMFKAKDNGRDNFCFYSEELGVIASRALTLEGELQKAIDLGQLYLMYQPKLNSRKNKVIGLEALVRWHHPEKGNVPPSDFISVAEDSDLIIDLDVYVINQTLTMIKALKDQGGYQLVPVSVNISSRHLMSGDLDSFLAQELKRFGLEGECLEIEITEHALIQDIEQCIDVLNSVKRLGVKVSIDDFGTGYSSLSYLRRIPFDILKIDRSFVNECTTIKEDREICSAIINLAHSLNLETIAEGVETKEQVKTLTALGCNSFQGYYFYRPLNLEDVKGVLANKVKYQRTFV